MAILRVEKRGDEYVIPIPREIVEIFNLEEGSAVEVSVVETERREGSFEEGVDAFIRTEPQHRNTYKALAES